MARPAASIAIARRDVKRAVRALFHVAESAELPLAQSLVDYHTARIGTMEGKTMQVRAAQRSDEEAVPPLRDGASTPPN